MTTGCNAKDIEQLLAEADELIRKIDSGGIREVKEAHRLEVEKHAQTLKKIKSEVQGKLAKTETSEIASSADGMHEALLDIVKATEALKKYLF